MHNYVSFVKSSLKLPEHLRIKCVRALGEDEWLLSVIVGTLKDYINCSESCDFSLLRQPNDGFVDVYSGDAFNSTFSSLHINTVQKPFNKGFRNQLFVNRGTGLENRGRLQENNKSKFLHNTNSLYK